jgi:hypothetical protein
MRYNRLTIALMGVYGKLRSRTHGARWLYRGVLGG